MRRGRVDQADDGEAELLGGAHQALLLAVALGMGHAEVVHRARHRVGALLLAHHHHPAAVQLGGAADHGAVVAEEAVAALFGEVGEGA
jgi:hypothetical protein